MAPLPVSKATADNPKEFSSVSAAYERDEVPTPSKAIDQEIMPQNLVKKNKILSDYCTLIRSSL